MKYWRSLASLVVCCGALAGCQQNSNSLPNAVYLDVAASQPAAAGAENIPDQTVLLMDDFRVTNAVITGRDFQPGQSYWARLYAKGKKEKNDPEVIGIVAQLVQIGDNNTTLVARFPSMAAWEFVPQKLQLFSTANDQEPIRTFAIDQLAYRTRQPDAAPGAKPAFAFVCTSTNLVADAGGHGVLKIGFAKLADGAKMQLSIEGAQIDASMEDPAGVLQHDPVQWFVVNTGTATFSLSNLSEYSDVVITGRDTNGVTYGPLRLHVVRAGK